MQSDDNVSQVESEDKSLAWINYVQEAKQEADAEAERQQALAAEQRRRATAQRDRELGADLTVTLRHILGEAANDILGGPEVTLTQPQVRSRPWTFRHAETQNIRGGKLPSGIGWEWREQRGFSLRHDSTETLQDYLGGDSGPLSSRWITSAAELGAEIARIEENIRRADEEAAQRKARAERERAAKEERRRLQAELISQPQPNPAPAEPEMDFITTKTVEWLESICEAIRTDTPLDEDDLFVVTAAKWLCQKRDYWPY